MVLTQPALFFFVWVPAVAGYMELASARVGCGVRGNEM